MIVSTAEIEVRYAETDMMGIVYHANYLAWLEVGRTLLLKEKGFPYKDLEARGLLLPVLEVQVSYLKPARYDDRIQVVTTMAEKPFAKIRLNYEVRRGKELLATGSSAHAFMSREGLPVKPPRDFLGAMAGFFA